MARRNQGPKLQYLKQRGAFYVTWTVNGRVTDISNKNFTIGP